MSQNIDNICECSVCDHKSVLECNQDNCNCCSLESHITGTNAEDTAKVFPGGSM